MGSAKLTSSPKIDAQLSYHPGAWRRSWQFVGFSWGWPWRYQSLAARIDWQQQTIDGIAQTVYGERLRANAQAPGMKRLANYLWYGNRDVVWSYYQKQAARPEVQGAVIKPAEPQEEHQSSESLENLARPQRFYTLLAEGFMSFISRFRRRPAAPETLVATASSVKPNEEAIRWHITETLVRLYAEYHQLAHLYRCGVYKEEQMSKAAVLVNQRCRDDKVAMLQYLTAYDPSAIEPQQFQDLWKQFEVFDPANMELYQKPFFRETDASAAARKQANLKKLYQQKAQELREFCKAPLAEEARQVAIRNLMAAVDARVADVKYDYALEDWQVSAATQLEQILHAVAVIKQAGEEALYAILDDYQIRLTPQPKADTMPEAMGDTEDQESTRPLSDVQSVRIPLTAATNPHGLAERWRKDKPALASFLHQQAALLQHASTDTYEEIKQQVQQALNKRYRQLAMRYHPDHHPEEATAANQIFAELSEWLQEQGKKLFQGNHQACHEAAYEAAYEAALRQLLQEKLERNALLKTHLHLTEQLIEAHREQNQMVVEHLERADKRFKAMDETLERSNKTLERMDKNLEEMKEDIDVSGKKLERLWISSEEQDRRLEAADRTLEEMGKKIAYVKQFLAEHGIADTDSAEPANSSPIAEKLLFFEAAKESRNQQLSATVNESVAKAEVASETADESQSHAAASTSPRLLGA